MDFSVRLHKNPWSESLTTERLREIVTEGAEKIAALLAVMMERGETKQGNESFALVFLDPTRPRIDWWATSELVVATIGIGPAQGDYLPNAWAKAEAHYRHGISNGRLVDDFTHCLGDHDFAWGASAEYNRAIAGGSGQKALQDHELALVFLKHVIPAINAERKAWLDSKRETGSHRWFNNQDEPVTDYREIRTLGII